MNDPSRLQRAVALFAAWESRGRAEDPAEILAQNEDLRELLGPMFVEEDAGDDEEPETLGDGAYRIIRELGRGGMGVVYEAEQIELGRRVVVKLLSDALAHSSQSRVRLRREAWTAARLRHPGIVQVLDVGLGDAPFVVMEFVDGAPLDRILENCSAASEREGITFAAALLNERHLPTHARASDTDGDAVLASPTWRRPWRETVLDIAARIADALEHAHRCGVVHRDVKPSNVLVCPDGRVVLVDLGLARAEDLPSLTVEGQFAGTPNYMSPEQASAGGVPVDARSDVFSLGATLFEMLTGRPPFEGETAQAVVQRILTEPAPDLRRFGTQFDADLRAVVAKSLERSPERRYASAAELGVDLRALLDQRPVLARPVSTWQRVMSWVRREPWLAGLAAAVFLSLAVGAAVATTLYLESKRQAQLADTRLADVERLADLRRVADLLAESETLWPAIPARRADFLSWIERAEDVAARLDLHRATLRRLRASAKRVTQTALDSSAATSEPLEEAAWMQERRDRAQDRLAGLEHRAGRAAANERAQLEDEIDHNRKIIAASDARIGEIEATMAEIASWEFSSTEAEWQHDLLAQLIDRMRNELLDPDTGAIADIRARLDLADGLRARSTGAFAASWNSTVAAIADPKRSPEYGGLSITAIIGLVPLGRDPQTGFYEFADVRTGDVPQRREDGTIDRRPSSAIILVLLPGDESVQIGASPDVSPQSPRFDHRARGNEVPIHELSLGPFLIGKHEVTRHQWRTAVGERLHPAATGGEPDWPVGFLSHDLGCEFAKRLGYELPTEAQWEYAARGGTDTPWWTGGTVDSLNGRANLADRRAADWNQSAVKHPELDDGHAMVAPVGSYPPNGFGLHDTAGNVWEWCLDHTTNDYRDPVRIGSGLRLDRRSPRRALRGGGFASGVDSLRSSFRSGDFPSNEAPDTGIRVARRIDTSGN